MSDAQLLSLVPAVRGSLHMCHSNTRRVERPRQILVNYRPGGGLLGVMLAGCEPLVPRAASMEGSGVANGTFVDA